MVKDEAHLLRKVLPIWRTYPVEKFVFYDDGSRDDTRAVIETFLSESKYIVLSDSHRNSFNESFNRSRMLEYSRDSGAEFVFSIDADELLTSNFWSMWPTLRDRYLKQNILLYWFNVVEGSLKRIRQDPLYLNNYKSFVLPLRHTGKFNLDLYKYHSPRTPNVNLPVVGTRSVGVIHLQAINRKFYALKQLWYKHFEFVEYRHSVEFINKRYDPVVNNLNFNSHEIAPELVFGIDFDPLIYDTILEEKGYLKYIQNNYNDNLITFGAEYL
jgi:hypothetical protein